jgi:DNA polymerase IV
VGFSVKPRVIIHADVDAFYASVEQRDHPELCGLAIAVGGSPDRRGVIMTASYEARVFGVRSAMPSRTAVGLCPQLIILPARFDAYQAASRTIMGIFEERASAVEPLSLDEAFLDVSNHVSSFEDATEHARVIKAAVFGATALTISLGVAGTKLVAKVASDFQKPDGLTAVPPEGSREFLAPLPVRRLWGVGPKTEAMLAKAGIERVGQLADADEEWIIRRVGPWALRWRSLARGLDEGEVAPRSETKQISREITFERDTRDGDRLRETLAGMASRLAGSLESTGAARTVHIKIRYADFHTITRQRRAGTLMRADEISRHAYELLEAWWDGKPVRLIGLGLSNFVTRPRDQLSLFDE